MSAINRKINPATNYTGVWLDEFPGLWDTLEKVPGEFYPHRSDVFRAFSFFPPAYTRVVILGQDPYPAAGKASGLAFGYEMKYKHPSGKVDSLANIITEVERTESELILGSNGREKTKFSDTSLETWARQGVLLMNTRLTVAPGKPMSHAGLGWEGEVSKVLHRLYHADNLPRVFMLWGREAQTLFDKATGVRDGADNEVTAKYVLRTSHPCKYSVHRGFRGCGHFQKANEFLAMYHQKEINWMRGDS